MPTSSTQRIATTEAVADVRAAYRMAVSKGENEPYISHAFTPPPTTGNCMDCGGTGYVRWHAIADQFNPEGYYEADPCDTCGCTGWAQYGLLMQKQEQIDQQTTTIYQLSDMLEELHGAVGMVLQNDAPTHELEEIYERLDVILNPPEPPDPE